VDELALLRESARTGLDDVRRVARRLRPGVLADLGLTSALAALATDFARHSAAPVRRSFGPGLPQLSPDAELVVYRVAQEALTNAARHAGARSVELSLTRQDAAVVLEVRDDGRGFAPLTEGSGLLGMRERAALVAAELTVTSRPRRGTTVRLRVPAVEALP
jgi:two-component system sensor histidine kinase UhpB